MSTLLRLKTLDSLPARLLGTSEYHKGTFYLKFIYYLDLKHQVFCYNPGHWSHFCIGTSHCTCTCLYSGQVIMTCLPYIKPTVHVSTTEKPFYLKFVYYLDLKHQVFCYNPDHWSHSCIGTSHCACTCLYSGMRVYIKPRVIMTHIQYIFLSQRNLKHEIHILPWPKASSFL